MPIHLHYIIAHSSTSTEVDQICEVPHVPIILVCPDFLKTCLATSSYSTFICNFLNYLKKHSDSSIEHLTTVFRGESRIGSDLLVSTRLSVAAADIVFHADLEKEG